MPMCAIPTVIRPPLYKLSNVTVVSAIPPAGPSSPLPDGLQIAHEEAHASCDLVEGRVVEHSPSFDETVA